MSGIKGRSGRKKSPSKLVNEALANVDQRLPDIFNALIDKAINGDKDAQIYLIDRRLGRPHQSIDQRTSLNISLTADDYARDRLIAQEIGTKLLDTVIEGGSNNAINGRSQEGVPTQANEGEEV